MDDEIILEQQRKRNNGLTDAELYVEVMTNVDEVEGWYGER